MLLVYFREDDPEAKALAGQLLPEGKTVSIDKVWSVRRERSHHDPSNFHNHVQARGRDVSIINQDGTQSHNTTRDDLPNWVIDWLIDHDYIKEEADLLARQQTVDPIVAEKVKRITQFGIQHELSNLPRVLAVLSWWFKKT